eukprot:5213419-Lingulodinium_polyedra.AAC.1
MESLGSEIRRLQKALELAEKELPTMADGSFDHDFDRAVDATILRINAEAPITIEPVQKFIDDWLPELSLGKDDVVLKSSRAEGSATKFFTLQFTSLP